MTQIMELMDKRAKAWEAAKAFLNSHSQNGGMVSAEDAATYDKMEKEVTDLTKDIERLQRQEQIDKMMSAPTSTPLTGKPGVKDEPEDKPGRASAAYKKAFWDNIRHPGNPAIRDVLEEGTDANGGYLVPIEFEHTLVQALNENNIMRTIGCKVIPHRTSARSLWQMVTRRRRGLPRTVPTPRAIRPSRRPALTLSS